MKMTGNTILITGGGSGIGRELALRFNALDSEVRQYSRHILSELAARARELRH